MANSILEKLLALKTGIGICWLGNLGWLIRTEGRLLAFDLDLDRDSRLQPSPIATEELAPVLDIQFITHGHGDHFSGPTSRILAEQSACRFILPTNCLDNAREFGIPESRITIAHPFQAFELDGIPIEPRRALHGHTNFTVYRRANPEDCGYVLTLDGRKLYQPGDTVLLQEQLEDLEDTDILFVSPTLHNTHIEASKTLIEFLQPDYIFPQHFGTYIPNEQNSYWTVGYPDELKAVLPESLQTCFHKLDQGDVFHIA
ncbi:MAG: MBL fold metallo-hydrolase [bacterium]|nr:MBL fold metallo-hydrolase [bacterium]